jgi:tRNA isopentenyl-2-thiomethyl-A-37 hydroxylase MiaE
MSKRKPLPYAAVFLVDQSLCEIELSKKSLLSIIQPKSGRLPPVDEIIRLVAEAIHHIHLAGSYLTDVKKIER